ncbi:hypothetical protein D187_007031 [Cystobacter fuscus DSM 2262]|uniref:Uncharacterized protein n=1 Tax=Cystobacter fuscus (strain ATCC 25194 / DSM 2262 / NBRC 100088 / M29) TaxID=1242864 RepID=S9P4X8_CYSF2|nr:hypothetical protein D187_007031 [Cystobacter fuscus DSM 2262]
MQMPCVPERGPGGTRGPGGFIERSATVSGVALTFHEG